MSDKELKEEVQVADNATNDKVEGPERFKEFFHYASKNTKLKIGLVVFVLLFIWGMVGPFTTEYSPRDRTELRSSAPVSGHIFGTTSMKEDVYTQFVHGLRTAFIIGALGGTMSTLIGLAIGFIAGYKGGWLDEVLMMLTNIMLVIPTVALFLIIAAYLEFRGVLMQSIILGCIQWPWIARTVRSQTLSLKQREFVNLARITGTNSWRIIVEEIVPNMLSYVVMIFIILFGSTILYSSALDFIGLGPTQGMSLGLMMQESYNHNAINYRFWWWFFPPGITLMMLISAMYFMQTGLDEVFNPQLREV